MESEICWGYLVYGSPYTGFEEFFGQVREFVGHILTFQVTQEDFWCKFELAYLEVKDRLKKVSNDGKTMGFHHSVDVVFNLFRYFSKEDIEKLTMDDLIVALLHDIIEDSDITFKQLYTLFWADIAKRVVHLTKGSWIRYLWDIPIKKVPSEMRWRLVEACVHYEKLRKECEWEWLHVIDEVKLYHMEDGNIFKELPCEISDLAKEYWNKSYFLGIRNLEYWDLVIKIADRIHSLETMDTFWSKLVIVWKLEETIQYFKPIIEHQFPDLIPVFNSLIP